MKLMKHGIKTKYFNIFWYNTYHKKYGFQFEIGSFFIGIGLGHKIKLNLFNLAGFQM